MKTLIILLLLGSSTTSRVNNLKQQTTVNTQQSYSADAYVRWGNGWRNGTIQYARTEQGGYIPISYSFEDYANSQLRGQFFPDQKFTPLNSNNPLAVKNNWTHTIGVGSLTAYTILN